MFMMMMMMMITPPSKKYVLQTLWSVSITQGSHFTADHGLLWAFTVAKHLQIIWYQISRLRPISIISV
jgi:hypothetical protein